MRLFVAIFPPPKVRRDLADRARGLVGGAAERAVRWTRPENVHLTLKFLGEVPEGAAERLRAPLAALAGGRTPFEVEPSVLGAFPNGRRSRVIWAGVDAGSAELRALAGDLEDALQEAGFGSERRPYVPHLTLGRCAGRPVRLEAEGAPLGARKFAARKLELVQSVTNRSGPVYTTLEEYPLGGGS